MGTREESSWGGGEGGINPYSAGAPLSELETALTQSPSEALENSPQTL